MCNHTYYRKWISAFRQGRPESASFVFQLQERFDFVSNEIDRKRSESKKDQELLEQCDEAKILRQLENRHHDTETRSVGLHVRLSVCMSDSGFRYRVCFYGFIFPLD